MAKCQEFDGDGNPVDSEPNDGDGHGTHVSGTATGAAEPSGDVPSFGVAPNADLYGGKVLDDSGGGSFAQIIAGIQWAVEETADVINMSLGATGYFPEMIQPLQNAQAGGTLTISSAGNSGDGSSGTPGNVYGTSVAVGASNESEEVADFSSGELIDTESAWGSDAPESWPAGYVVPDVAAPGVDTLSSVPGGGYDDTYSGTSMASPHVAGSAAIVVSAASGLSPQAVRNALEETAEKPDDWGEPGDERDTRYGLGIVDVEAATSLVALDTGVTGVVESDGSPVGGVTVDISGGGTTETADDGSFELPLEPGDYDLTVSGFGVQETTVTVTVEDGDSFTDVGVVAVDPVVELALLSDQPDVVEGGSDVPVTVEAANVDTLTVVATRDYDTANADLFVDDQAATFGDPVSLGGVSGQLTVTVETTPDTAGTLGLSSYVSPEDLTDAAVQILGQAVTHIAEPVEDGDPDVASVRIDPAPQGGQTTLTVSASFVDTLTLEALWADWDVTIDSDGGASDTEDRVATDSEFELVWDSAPTFTEPSLTVSLPDHYVGGTFGITATATGGDTTVETTGTFDVTSN